MVREVLLEDVLRTDAAAFRASAARLFVLDHFFEGENRSAEATGARTQLASRLMPFDFTQLKRLSAVRTYLLSVRLLVMLLLPHPGQQFATPLARVQEPRAVRRVQFEYMLWDRSVAVWTLWFTHK